MRQEQLLLQYSRVAAIERLQCTGMHGCNVRRDWGLSPVDFVILYLLIKCLVKKCFSFSFEVMKSNFTTDGPTGKFFGHPFEKFIIAPNPRKFHLTPMLTCAVIMSIPMQCKQLLQHQLQRNLRQKSSLGKNFAVNESFCCHLLG